jgi:hypothetical protein
MVSFGCSFFITIFEMKEEFDLLLTMRWALMEIVVQLLS